MAKKIPLRQCVGCGQMGNKKEMIRVIKTAEGAIILDTTGKQNGRGAYVCARRECLDQALKHKGLERSLKTSIPDEVTEGLMKEFDDRETR